MPTNIVNVLLNTSTMMLIVVTHMLTMAMSVNLPIMAMVAMSINLAIMAMVMRITYVNDGVLWIC